jgi:hypothetical protein
MLILLPQILVGFAMLPLVMFLLLMLSVLLQVEPVFLHGTMPLLLIPMLVGLALLLVVLRMVLLLHELMPVGSRLLAFARRGLQLAVLVYVGVGSGAGWRPAAAPTGGAVGVVAAAGVGSWQLDVGGPDGQRASCVAAGDPLAPVGGGWRSAVATSVHEQRVAASGVASVVRGQ